MKYVGSSVRKDPRGEIRRRGDPRFSRLDERASAEVAFSEGLIGGLVAGIDALLVFCVGLVVFLTYLGWNDNTGSSYLLALGINTLATVAAFNSAGLYRCEYLTRPVYQIKKILPICGAVFLILLALAFSLKVSSQFSRVWAFTWFGSIVVLISLQRVCVYRLLKRWTARGYLTRNIVIVGAGEQADRLLQRLDQGQEPWNRIKGIFDDRSDRIDSTLEKYPNLGDVKILGTVDNLLEYARHKDNRIDDVIVTLPWHADRRLQFIIEKLRQLPLHIHLGCDLVAYMFPRPTFSAIANVPLLHIAHKPLTGWKYVAKAVEDRVLGVILLILLTPLALLIALAIKLEGPGPVLFRQQRHGFNNKVFTVLKFRTMHHDRPPEVGAPQAKRNDPRVTRIGNLLRRTSLDELPQVINVVQGTMSLVGPRPHPLSLDYEFAPKIDGYFARHRLKPGITGWAQVNGYRGETETAEKMRKRVEYDLHYIENWSLLFDLQILLMTPFAGVSHFHKKQSF